MAGRDRMVTLNRIRVVLQNLAKVNKQICVESQVQELKKSKIKLYKSIDGGVNLKNNYDDVLEKDSETPNYMTNC